MAFQSIVTDKIDVESVQYVIRRLGWRSLEAASAKWQDWAMSQFAKHQAVAGAAKEKPEEKPASAAVAKIRPYDKGVVLQAGVLIANGEKVTPADLDELSLFASDALFNAVLDLSLPETETERGNDSGAATEP